MNIKVIQADYADPQHAKIITEILDKYALDAMGGGQGLTNFTKRHLVSELNKLPHAFSVLAFVDDQPAGLVNCFEAFSTFACKPLVNIHDVSVLPQFRGLGVSLRMLERVENIAQAKGCCKITLEVLSNNTIAKNAYTKLGYEGYELDPEAGHALFWQKPLN